MNEYIKYLERYREAGGGDKPLTEAEFWELYEEEKAEGWE